jgi:hypothetical protein
MHVSDEVRRRDDYVVEVNSEEGGIGIILGAEK